MYVICSLVDNQVGFMSIGS